MKRLNLPLLAIALFSVAQFSCNTTGKPLSEVTSTSDSYSIQNAKNEVVNGEKEGLFVEYYDDNNHLTTDKNYTHYRLCTYNHDRMVGKIKEYNKNGELILSATLSVPCFDFDGEYYYTLDSSYNKIGNTTIRGFRNASGDGSIRLCEPEGCINMVYKQNRLSSVNFFDKNVFQFLPGKGYLLSNESPSAYKHLEKFSNRFKSNNLPLEEIVKSFSYCKMPGNGNHSLVVTSDGDSFTVKEFDNNNNLVSNRASNLAELATNSITNTENQLVGLLGYHSVDEYNNAIIKCKWCGKEYKRSEGYNDDYCSEKCYTEHKLYH